MAAFVCGLGVHLESGAGFGGDDVGAADVVLFPREGEEVQDAEDGHFDAEEEGGNADFNVGRGDAGGGFDSTSGGEKRDGDLDGRKRM